MRESFIRVAEIMVQIWWLRGGYFYVKTHWIKTSYKKQAFKNRINKPFANNYKTPRICLEHFGKDEVTGSNPVISSIVVANVACLRRFSFFAKNRHSMRFVAPPLPKKQAFRGPHFGA